ncbi:hypothetical protein QBC40DRAFT_337852 [Triangularia verruculosa]|uniref:Zn(2)-C6 fungal-type domain-containing protein n=1 Tax=Triangularia verruculosa TaxID=2587418 RepID=A0AAN6XSK6_9PEZI|nr:hypothetical protein QBC40DRAFT_337852 [Triangularia verruculosa]
MDNTARNTCGIVPGLGDSHAGPGPDESDADLAGTPEWFDFEQWELDQDLRGLSALRNSESGPNTSSLTPQSSSIEFDLDFDLEEGLRRDTSQRTEVAPLVSDFDVISQQDVLSLGSTLTTEGLNSISLASDDAANPLVLQFTTNVAKLPVRHDSILSGYYGDHSDKTRSENKTFSDDIVSQERFGAGNTSYAIRPRGAPSTTKSNTKDKSWHNTSTARSQLASENTTNTTPHDCFHAFRNILPRPNSQPSPLSNTDSDAQALIPRKGKRKPNTDASRKKIKLVRRVGACLRCRIFKESCDENEPCGRCTVALTNAKVFRVPCFRVPLDDVIAFRAGNSRTGRTRSEPIYPRWAGDDTRPRTIVLSYPFKKQGAGEGAIVSVQCRKFIPCEWDVMEEPWPLPHGRAITMKSTPFACYDDGTTVTAVAGYIQSTKEALLHESLDGVSDELLLLSTAEAIRYCLKFKDSSVAIAMNIRAASFFSRTKMIITGTNVLDLPYFYDSRFLVNGGYPVPSMIDYQIDYMAITYMWGQMEMLVKQLKKLIFSKNQRKSWYEVYLTVFVLLQSLETVQARQIDIIRRYEPEGGEPLSKARNIGNRMMQEWKHSAKTLIYHYRAVLKGMVPFAATWNDKHATVLRRDCGLDEKALQYVQQMSDIIGGRLGFLKQLTNEGVDNDAAKPLAWIAQLYVDD